MEKKKTTFGLTGNQLKIIALLTMTCDHIGKQLLPENMILQIFGRLAFPIFAYMIAEGCRYTKNRKSYLLTIVGVATLCQVVYFVAMGSLYQCILVTFSISIILIYILDGAVKKKSILWWTGFAGCVVVVVMLCEALPKILTHTDFYIDYGIWGVLLPVAIFLGTTKNQKILFATCVLALLALSREGIQWYGLCAIPLLYLYNESRGKVKLKYFFYLYYPLHLVTIYLLSIFIHR